MTSTQISVLALINSLNSGEFASWFLPSEVMAFVQIESAFRPHAYRFEPRLNEGSFGLMQVLESTARGMMPSLASGEAMYDPTVGLRIGMLVAKQTWEIEARRLGGDPSYEVWTAGYNEGPLAALRQDARGEDPDPAYTKVWLAAQAHWQAQGVDGDV